jgi:acetyl esterase
MSSEFLSPRMAGLLTRIHRAQRTPFHAMAVDEARRAYEAGAEVLDLPRAPLARVQAVEVPVGDGALRPARLYAPSNGRLPALLYMHGGGFTVGGLETHDSLCRQLALRSGAAVLALDYRLAPEHRFPAAADDAWDALRWLAGQGGDALKLDASRLAVGGDSAGATLAAVAAIEAARAGLPLRAQLLITPGTAAHTDTASHRLFANGFLLDAATIDWFFGHYIDRSQRGDWRFAPLNADDVEGVAPAIVLLAECDPLVDEGLAYADKLRRAAVGVELDLVRGVTHDFIKMGRALPEALAAQDWVGRMLREALSADRG